MRVVTGAYRATPTRSLEIEAFTPPLDLYLDGRLAAFQRRLANSEVGQVVEKAYSQIKARIKNRRGRKIAIKIAIKGQSEFWAR
jgi:hypothetical protein